MHNKHLTLLHRSLNKLILKRQRRSVIEKWRQSGHKESVCHRGWKLTDGTGNRSAHSLMFIQWMLGGGELFGGLQDRTILCPTSPCARSTCCFMRTGWAETQSSTIQVHTCAGNNEEIVTQNNKIQRRKKIQFCEVSVKIHSTVDWRIIDFKCLNDIKQCQGSFVIKRSWNNSCIFTIMWTQSDIICFGVTWLTWISYSQVSSASYLFCSETLFKSFIC